MGESRPSGRQLGETRLAGGCSLFSYFFIVVVYVVFFFLCVLFWFCFILSCFLLLASVQQFA